MSKFHSTVSRRDFMKTLGIGAAGLGAVGAAAPILHDLDEIAASPKGVAEKRPWYVKEKEYLDTTTEIDWAKMERFEQGSYDNMMAHISLDEFQRRSKIRHENRIKWMKDNKSGCTRRDYALKVSGWLRPYSSNLGRDFLGEPREKLYGAPDQPEAPFGTYKQMITEAPAWNGTSDENARMMRAVCKFSGASTVGFGEVIEEKTRKLTWATQFGSRRPYVFENVEHAYETKDKLVIPTKCKYAILFVIQYDNSMVKLAPSKLTDAITGKAYDQADIVRYRLQAFLNSMGYECCGGGLLGLVARPAWGVIAGLGEYGRLHTLLTPEWGPGIRMSQVVYTDMPVTPTNPIDFGGNRFCYTCRRCSDGCPVDAIDKEKEPGFEITSANSTGGNPDHLDPKRFNGSPAYARWPFNHFACNSYWFDTDSSCSICNGVCVFVKERLASIHEFVKPIVASTTLLNSFFFNMDDAFGFGVSPEEASEEWWDKDHPIIGYNY